MSRFFQHRFAHYLVLVAVGVSSFLVNLGTPSLWDRDEGCNATAALEMVKSGDYIVPHFNSQLRVDKPALLYWLQAAAYHLFGIHEFSARLPSALASLFTLLLCYELGRSMFGKTTGLLAGLMIATTPLMCGAARFANPDALLQLFIVAMMFFFWQSQHGGALWFAAFGAAAGLAVLAKGPVGIVLPLAAISVYCWWTGHWRSLFRPALIAGALTLLLVALPWYLLVTVESKNEFLKGFLLEHNVNRFLEPMENHRGSILYYPMILWVGMVPWSVFWWLLCWQAYQFVRGARRGGEWEKGRRGEGENGRGGERETGSVSVLGVDGSPVAARPVAPGHLVTVSPCHLVTVSPCHSQQASTFLASWLVVVVLFFSLAATKLPNYVLPALLPCALLASRLLIRWCRGEIELPMWSMYSSLLGLASVGVVVVAGTMIGSGAWPIPGLRLRTYPGTERLAWVGLGPMIGAAIGWQLMSRGRRAGVVWVLALTGIGFMAPLAMWASACLDNFKAPRSLVEGAQVQRTDTPIDIYCWNVGHLPSLNFYARRDLTHCESQEDLLSHLRNPTPAYLILPVQEWHVLKSQVPMSVPVHELAKHHDMLHNQTLIVISNH